jgi:hypothetical protein
MKRKYPPCEKWSKNKLCCGILTRIGFGEKKSYYSPGNFSMEEVLAIYKFVRSRIKKGG